MLGLGSGVETPGYVGSDEDAGAVAEGPMGTSVVGEMEEEGEGGGRRGIPGEFEEGL